MGRVMSEQGWTEYRQRAASLAAEHRLGRLNELNGGVKTMGPVRCPCCDGPVLTAIDTTLYPCEPCDMGWYPADLDFHDPRRGLT